MSANNTFKKPAPANGGGASVAATKKKATTAAKKKRGVDALLTTAGKQLPAGGGSLTVRLIKGPNTTTTADPVDAKAPLESFPLLAKFPESVVRPDFTQPPWCEARLYQQDKPKPEEDSDEEEKEEQAAQPKKRWKYNRKRDQIPDRQWVLQEQVDFLETMVARREKRNDGSSSNTGGGGGGGSSNSHSSLSSRYEGLPENNNSAYVLLRLAPPGSYNSSSNPSNDDEDSTKHRRLPEALLVQPMPTPNCTIAFAQPAARKTYSLNQAEQAITDQRMGIVRNMHGQNDPSNMMMNMMMMNGGKKKDDSPGGSGGGGGGGDATASTDAQQQSQQQQQLTQPRAPLIIPKKKNTSRNRLINKLKKKSAANAANEEEEEGDDVMGDVTFRSRKGTSGAARRELLQMSESHVTVSNEGVLGGSNDAAFGGRQRFANVLAEKDKAASSPAKKSSAGGGGDDADDGGGGGKPAERGADGAAMEEDFYQRDVQAEYEELDFDANEQFDDDDVDLGEGEMVVDSSGFGGNDADDAELDDDSDELDAEDETLSGAEGLASLAGFKAMLARARGEAPLLPVDGVDPTGATTADSKKDDLARKRAAAEAERAKRRDANDHMAKIIARTTGKKNVAQVQHNDDAANGQALGGDDDNKLAAPGAGESAAPAPASKELANQVDANGKRIISLDAVRREIWLENGSIPMKRLMKIFDVRKKASKERRDRFMEVVKELCTMTADPLAGNLLVLKQHYSNMG